MEYAPQIMSDGIMLEGWVGRPAVPDGVKVPTVFVMSPYLAYTDTQGEDGFDGSPSDPEWWVRGGQTGAPPREDSVFVFGFHVDELISAGYAVAVFSSRGTAGSQGCAQWHGDRELEDIRDVLDWLADQTWSNGRIGILGFSYTGGTALLGAMTGHPAVKTIITIAGTLDYSLWGATPQGLQHAYSRAVGNYAIGLTGISATPLAPIEDRSLPVTDPEGRVCPEVTQAWLEDDAFPQTGQRPAGFLTERARIARLADATASIYFITGFYDGYYGFTAHQASQFLPPGSRMVQGPWVHTWPTGGEGFHVISSCTEYADELWPRPVWHEEVLLWYDYWLKGTGADAAGPPEHLKVGTAEFQDGCGYWHEDHAWPPDGSTQEILYLADGGLSPQPGGSDRVFLSAATGSAQDYSDASVDSLFGWPSWCAQDASPVPYSLQFLGDPLSGPALVAGNPHAWLEVSSDQAEGTFQVYLLAVPEGLHCQDPTTEPGPGLLAAGGVDLRFHAGSLSAQPWSANEPGHVRVDLTRLAQWVQAGDRLAVVISYGETHDGAHGQGRSPDADPAVITLHGGQDIEASHIVVPVFNGTFGGGPVTIEYPPMPILGHTFGVDASPEGHP